jgi:uncharacterized membrane protein YraQ (UPF0718 family)
VVATSRSWRGPNATVALVLAGVAFVVVRPYLTEVANRQPMGTWSTLVLAITLQAFPFLVGGVLASSLVAAFWPRARLVRTLRSHPTLSVPAAAAAGVFLPGCECGSVPIGRRLIERGAPVPSALAFVLAAPAINPTVLVATAVAFPGHPEVVLARFIASLGTAVVVALAVERLGWRVRTSGRHPTDGQVGGWQRFRSAFLHDVLHTGGFLVAGAAAAATIQMAVPRTAIERLAGTGPLAVLALALLAVVLCTCSEADAFVAASLAPFSMTARLAFMVTGPAMDLKLLGLHGGSFGWAFAGRVAVLTIAVAVAASGILGWVLW